MQLTVENLTVRRVPHDGLGAAAAWLAAQRAWERRLAELEARAPVRAVRGVGS